MSKNKYHEFVAWIWSNKDIRLYPRVLTDWNPDPSLPQPPLSPLEAENLFLHLEELKLVLPRDVDGGPVYAINRFKEDQWAKTISALKHPTWSKIKTYCGTSLFWILSLTISGFIGGGSRKIADDLFGWAKLFSQSPPQVIEKDANTKEKGIKDNVLDAQ